MVLPFAPGKRQKFTIPRPSWTYGMASCVIRNSDQKRRRGQNARSDPQLLAGTSTRLKLPAGNRPFKCSCAARAPRRWCSAKFAPDVVVLDLSLPGLDGARPQIILAIAYITSAAKAAAPQPSHRTRLRNSSMRSMSWVFCSARDLISSDDPSIC